MTPAFRASARSMPSMVCLSFITLEKPRKIRDRMTPELPRAPRSMAEAQMAVAWPTVSGDFCRSSPAAVPMVRLMLVPVSPSGTGKTLSSLIFCFSAFREAEA